MLPAGSPHGATLPCGKGEVAWKMVWCCRFFFIIAAENDP